MVRHKLSLMNGTSRTRVMVLGTRNRKKRGELLELLGPHGFELPCVADFAHAVEVEETGSTFAENAALKAAVQAQRLQQWVLGEDSGLLVDALGGAPGVYSARFSGIHATDATNNALLLEKLRSVSAANRGAHYVCHMALADPAGEIVVRAEGICRGRIRFEASGTGGFGYDPLFEIAEYHLTFGELDAAVKGVISHRSRAVRLFMPQLLQLVDDGRWPITP